MRARQQPRYQGKVTSWKDEQGYGFISPNGGGPAVFLHVSAVSGGAVRPALDDVVTYHLETNDKGQPRAANVAIAGAGRNGNATGHGPENYGVCLAAAFGLALCLAIVGTALPGLVGVWYAAASLLAFMAYGFDKAAARAGRQRTPENTLHLVALAGGWPGALLAQRLLRHKTRKQPFRAIMWLTVVLNCAALGYLLLSRLV